SKHFFVLILIFAFQSIDCSNLHLYSLQHLSLEKFHLIPEFVKIQTNSTKEKHTNLTVSFFNTFYIIIYNLKTISDKQNLLFRKSFSSYSNGFIYRIQHRRFYFLTFFSQKNQIQTTILLIISTLHISFFHQIINQTRYTGFISTRFICNYLLRTSIIFP